ncbi:MAG: hypothetical protein KAR44_11595 [Candidatus Aegiribacteria sp.]|nr:hypothetical protein [Candidatus Aegiribacteria sp.]
MRVYLFLVLSICLAAAAATPDYQPPFNVMANGAQIELSVGHANPLITDWNGDGLKDLILGQYSSGKLRYYENNDTNDSPMFGNYTFMQADGVDISLSSG